MHNLGHARGKIDSVNATIRERAIANDLQLRIIRNINSLHAPLFAEGVHTNILQACGERNTTQTHLTAPESHVRNTDSSVTKDDFHDLLYVFAANDPIIHIVDPVHDLNHVGTVDRIIANTGHGIGNGDARQMVAIAECSILYTDHNISIGTYGRNMDHGVGAGADTDNSTGTVTVGAELKTFAKAIRELAAPLTAGPIIPIMAKCINDYGEHRGSVPVLIEMDVAFCDTPGLNILGLRLSVGFRGGSRNLLRSSALIVVAATDINHIDIVGHLVRRCLLVNHAF